MEKFIPYEKLSKKKKRELDAKRRGTWAIDPTVRKPANPKAYNRKTAQKWRDDDPASVPVSFGFAPVFFIIYAAIDEKGQAVTG